MRSRSSDFGCCFGRWTGDFEELLLLLELDELDDELDDRERRLLLRLQVEKEKISFKLRSKMLNNILKQTVLMLRMMSTMMRLSIDGEDDLWIDFYDMVFV